MFPTYLGNILNRCVGIKEEDGNMLVSFSCPRCEASCGPSKCTKERPIVGQRRKIISKIRSHLGFNYSIGKKERKKEIDR